MSHITIGGRRIGPGEPLYFVADVGANHDGSLDRAYRLIELAAEAGADAAKFQNFIAPTIVSRRGFEELGGQIAHQAAWAKPVFEVYEDASVPEDWTPLLAQRCREVGIDYFTSPYDLATVDAVDPTCPRSRSARATSRGWRSCATSRPRASRCCSPPARRTRTTSTARWRRCASARTRSC